MPTTEWTREDDPLRIECEVDFTTTPDGRLLDVWRIIPVEVFVVMVDVAYEAFLGRIPARLSAILSTDAWENHITEIRKQIEDEIEGAKEADGERRRKEKDDERRAE